MGGTDTDLGQESMHDYFARLAREYREESDGYLHVEEPNNFTQYEVGLYQGMSIVYEQMANVWFPEEEGGGDG